MHRPSFRPQRILGARYAPSTEPEEEKAPPLQLSLDPDLIRGASLRDVLRCAGHVLASSEGSAKDFEKSIRVESLDVFICHNWDTGRWSKLVSLALYSNIQTATVVTVAVLVSLILADIFSGSLLSWYRFRGDRMVDLGIWCSVFLVPCYWSIIIFSHDLFHTPGPNIFFDKLCIDQVDTSRRSQGINAIPGIIAKAKAMVVVLTPSALTKVWTMFELSSFLIMHGPRNLSVQPALLSVFSFIGSLVVYFAVLAFITINSTVSPNLQTWVSLVIFAVLLPPSALFAWYLYKWGLEIKELRHQAEHFSFDKAICAVEEDRTKLKSMIAHVFYVSVASELDGTDSEKVMKIRQFQSELQILVAEAVQNSLGRTGLPLRFWMSINIPFIASELDSVSGDLKHVWHREAPSYIAGQTILRCLANISFVFALESVLSYLCIVQVHRQCLCTSKWADRLKLGLMMSPCIFSFPIIGTFSQVTARALLYEKVPTATLILMCASVLSAVLITLFFHWRS